MKDIESIKKRISEIEADERYKSGLKKPATIDINAPLALIQLEFETELKTLKWVLSLIDMKKVIGIDLTGSEKRASGVASLLGDGQAQTTRLKTDEEIIGYVLDAQPTLVSIDSPLSLPEDPTKIYRECELTLKRRGIGVYWCLLPSMEKLTRRGIGLAGLLRKHGHQVIESYPGAAQDILGIPRKSKGIQMLAEGLAEYGIKGNLAVSHDELDAITSAIVGQLYLQGKYEALGCLILPKV